MGSKLLASNTYHKCSTNDSVLTSAYGNNEEFWKSEPLSYVPGVPGITSSLFSGEKKLITMSDGVIVTLQLHNMTVLLPQPKC